MSSAPASGAGRAAAWLLALAAAVALCLVLDIALGSVRIPVGAVVRILLGQQAEPAAWVFIVDKIRLPKALTAVLVGSGLAVSGVQMQTLFRNPLASPSVLGSAPEAYSWTLAGPSPALTGATVEALLAALRALLSA